MGQCTSAQEDSTTAARPKTTNPFAHSSEQLNVGGTMPFAPGYHETLLPQQTSRRVEAFWSFQAESKGHSIVLPDGRCDILLRTHAHAPHTHVPVITGPATRPYKIHFEKGDHWVGLRLRPDQARLLWADDMAGAPDHVLRGAPASRRLPALARLNPQTACPEDFAALLPSPDATADQRVTQAIEVIHMSGGRLAVEDLARHSACSARHLNRLFRAFCGLSTKSYSSLVQFHRALRLVRQERLSLSDAAAEAGYADQAHLTRSFRRYGGFTPATLPQALSQPSIFS